MTDKSAQKPAELFPYASKKRTLYIVLLVFLILLIVTAGGIVVKQKSKTSSDAKPLESMAKNGNSVVTEDGEITIKDGEVPENFPEDLTLYHSAEVGRTSQAEDGVSVVMKTTDSVNDVTNFYAKNLEDNNWKSVQKNKIEESSLITAEKSDRLSIITIVKSETEGYTEINIVVGPKS